ncbi:4'-phosphopantetheinyl transferase [Streptomyces sp. Act143]|uniref:4'-phosphopantetheinyl transferase family protein n=1 Tax=Streptomyces sp. Act143 TaxID=2200760 RepID=UPI000D6846F3|nr:4'-phosphopantetheinyl transferase superfamily protein [Streptomyces sp. Act143]PWI17106.1 4'-phosphopantetheinyl transferase [Streptomyces sp. Act143]
MPRVTAGPRLLGRLLPGWARAVETSADAPVTALHDEERALLAPAAVERRRREFATGRVCARQALAALGVPLSGPLLRGPDGAPSWPDGVRGSITHCPGYRAAAVAFAADARALGIDAEPPAPLSPAATAALTTAAERAALPPPHARVPWETVLFSAKEAAYKAWMPTLGPGRSLALRDARVRLVPVTAHSGRIEVRHARREVPRLCGAYRLTSDLIVTAAYLPTHTDADAVAAAGG